MTNDEKIEPWDVTQFFSALADRDRAELSNHLERRFVRRGEALIRQGRPAQAFYLVVSGRFSVTIEGRKETVSEIGPNQPIGEIAFLTGGTRTATVTALRDSIVLRLDRQDFDALSQNNPDIWRGLTTTMANRLAATTAAVPDLPDPRPRTIAVMRAGNSPIPDRFLDQFIDVFHRDQKTLVVTSENASEVLGCNGDLHSEQSTRALNELETAYDCILMLADHSLTAWTEKVVRHADLLLLVGHHAKDPNANVLEGFAAGYVAADQRRLVLVHETRTDVKGTQAWLEDRNVIMHHHVALDDVEDFERLRRFIDGKARGFVACGGGALCSAHVGVIKALQEHGHTFDILGGTSAGSAMVAAFALGHSPQEMAATIDDMFVTHKAMRRYTVPKYSVLDHANFDKQLKRYFAGRDIEDLWLPTFAVSTNLSRYKLHIHRTGDLWTAIRASASIPVLLPPVYTDDGQMLVDGCLLDNVPIRVMHQLKTGPNIVVSFMVPELERFDVDYDQLPSRSDLLKALANPLQRGKLPGAPGPSAVLMRAMMANRRDFQRHLKPSDTLLVPPISSDIGPLDWHLYQQLIDHAYQWTSGQLLTNGACSPEQG